jgi:DNA-binding NarL/FixJ family response regulator
MPKDILIVDNHIEICEEIKKEILVTYPKVNIAFAHTGLDALKQCGIITPEIIFMDIAMPMLGGLETTKAIIEKFSTVKIIIISSKKTEHEILNLAVHGARGFIEKGCSGNIYTDSIDAVFKGDLYFSAKIKLRVSQFIDSFEKKNKNRKLMENEPDNYSIISVTAEEKLPSDFGFSEIDLQILFLLYQKLSNMEIKNIICREIKTVEYHIKQMMIKTDCKNRHELRDFVIENGWHKDNTFDNLKRAAKNNP